MTKLGQPDHVWGRMEVLRETLYGRFTFTAAAIIAELPQPGGKMWRLIISPYATYVFEAGAEEDVRLLAAEEKEHPSIADEAAQLRTTQAITERLHAELPLVKRGARRLEEQLIAADCWKRDDGFRIEVDVKRYAFGGRVCRRARLVPPPSRGTPPYSPEKEARTAAVTAAVARHLGIEALPAPSNPLEGDDDLDREIWDLALVLGREQPS